MLPVGGVDVIGRRLNTRTSALLGWGHPTGSFAESAELRPARLDIATSVAMGGTDCTCSGLQMGSLTEIGLSKVAELSPVRRSNFPELGED